MHLPAHLKIGKARYTLHVRPTLKPGRVMGRAYHAILFEMGHPLSRNEPFVTQFSHLLTKAIYSARF